MLVKHLLYTEKFTIDGARQRIDQYRRTGELRASARAGVRGRAGAEVRATLEEVLAILDGKAPPVRAAQRRRTTARGRGRATGQGDEPPFPLSSVPLFFRCHEHPGHQRRRHPGPGPGAAGRRVPRGGHRHRGRARPGAERHLPLAHAAPAAPARPAAGRRLADRRHADRLRHARDPGADAGAARLRLLRREPRPQHGRGRALLRHGGRRHGGGHAGRAGHRHLVRRQPAGDHGHLPRPAAGAGPAHHRGARLPGADAAQHQLPPDPGGGGARAFRSPSWAAATSPSR